ncbi:MAG: SMC-Scp complex subunit ScpB [Candidatus Competibacteraceae bacterium]|nr:SMC-Scp complex subunit ScpB [Candidatus Competibacteraceae bacterium]MCB1807742.1 SMC-Scp complex subunit ScpB [Candidatus Competibacteraceae bacterium]MCB1814642.1 SMC-Scp complex subunit ScpB [Candidatus Competibacteraceae bacterium]
MHPPALELILEAALLAAGEAVSLDRLGKLFDETQQPDKNTLRNALAKLAENYQGRGIELAEVAGGYRIQVRADWSPWITRLWEEKPGRYSRALLETLALIAYRQPITRGEIAEVRGVTVSTGLIRTLQERGWIKIIGHREVPGRPALYATTSEFLSYFNLKNLSELPPLLEPRDLDAIAATLEGFKHAADDTNTCLDDNT